MRDSVERRAVKQKSTRQLPGKKVLISGLIAVLVLTLIGVGIFALLQSAKNVSRYTPGRYTTERNTPGSTDSVEDKASVPRLAIGSAAPAGFSSKKPKPTASPSSGGGVKPSNCNPATSHTNPSSPDVVVNKKHCLVPITFTPALSAVSCGGSVGYVQPSASGPLTQLCAAAAKAGVPVRITSSFRSYSDQVSTYNYWVAANGSSAAADQVSARPGFSEHQTGFAVDLAAGSCALECFGGTAQYQWMQANAANFWFIQRYYVGSEATTGYSSETWHYRYVGQAVALDMKSRGIKTLEQYFGISGGDYAG